MADRTDEDLLAGIRSFWESRDPVPDVKRRGLD